MQVSEATWKPQRLFRGGAQGALFDPSVNDSVWQDTGAITPAEIGDPVGLIQDISGNSNNATQSTDADRPIRARQPVSGITNKLAEASAPSEDYSGSSWDKNNVTIVNNGQLNEVSETITNANHSFYPNLDAISFVNTTTYSFFSIVKPEADDWVQMTVFSSGGFDQANVWVNYDVTNGVTGNEGSSVVLSDIQVVPDSLSAIYPELDGAYICLMQATSNSTADGRPMFALTNNTDSAGRLPVYAGVVEKNASFSRIAAVEGARDIDWYLENYQKVVSQYDVSEQGVPDAFYLDFNGVNEFMTIPGSDSTFKFMHDGTGGTFAAAFTVEKDDNNANANFISSRNLNTEIGIRIGQLDGGAFDAAVRLLISNGSAAIFNQDTVNNVYDRRTPFVLRGSYIDHGGDDGFLYIDSNEEISGPQTASPSALDASNDINIMADSTGSAILDGKWFGGLFIDEFLQGSDARNTDSFYAQKSGAVLA